MKRNRSKRKRPQEYKNGSVKRVQILDEESVLYIEGRECLARMEEEVELEQSQLNPPKSNKKKKRRKRF